MTYRIFIDGEAGTTGLQISERLAQRSDLEMIRLDEANRKDEAARKDAFAQADVAILCLPDDAARDAVALTQDLKVRLIDASSAHRTDPNWIFGFPELSRDRRAAIAEAKRVSNPGCYSTGAIALIAPLVNAGLIAPDEAVSVNAVSGYTGGGKDMIAEFSAGQAPAHFVYGLAQNHKHLPEIIKLAGLQTQPVFAPSVGGFAQGMAVQIPLRLSRARTLKTLHHTLAEHYHGETFVRVMPLDPTVTRIEPTALNGTNQLNIHIQGDDAAGVGTIIAVLDNLGKGASGAAVQNLNIMLGLEETLGL